MRASATKGPGTPARMVPAVHDANACSYAPTACRVPWAACARPARSFATGDIEHRTLESQPVTGPGADQPLLRRPEDPAESGDVGVQTPGRRRRRRLAPDVIDELAPGDGRPLAEREYGEDGALLGWAEVDLVTVDEDGERSEAFDP